MFCDLFVNVPKIIYIFHTMYKSYGGFHVESFSNWGMEGKLLRKLIMCYSTAQSFLFAVDCWSIWRMIRLVCKYFCSNLNLFRKQLFAGRILSCFSRKPKGTASTGRKKTLQVLHNLYPRLMARTLTFPALSVKSLIFPWLPLAVSSCLSL